MNTLTLPCPRIRLSEGRVNACAAQGRATRTEQGAHPQLHARRVAPHHAALCMPVHRLRLALSCKRTPRRKRNPEGSVRWAGISGPMSIAEATQMYTTISFYNLRGCQLCWQSEALALQANLSFLSRQASRLKPSCSGRSPQKGNMVEARQGNRIICALPRRWVRIGPCRSRWHGRIFWPRCRSCSLAPKGAPLPAVWAPLRVGFTTPRTDVSTQCDRQVHPPAAAGEDCAVLPPVLRRGTILLEQ